MTAQAQLESEDGDCNRPTGAVPDIDEVAGHWIDAAELVAQRWQMRQVGGIDPVPGHFVDVRHACGLAGCQAMAVSVISWLVRSCHLDEPAVSPARNCFCASR